MFAPLTFETLGNLDFRVLREMADKALKDVTNDLDQRPRDDRPREVTIKLKFVPKDRGVVAIDTEVAAKLPGLRTNTVLGRLVADGKGEIQLCFEDISPENPDQMTFRQHAED
jgi:hypothetical protein